MGKKDREIEVRFLEINPQELVTKLQSLEAEDLGEQLLSEVIFYDKELKWQYEEKKVVRLRRSNKGVYLAYKKLVEQAADGTIELEFKIDDMDTAKRFLEELGLIAYRYQEKKRHTLKYKDVIIDIDIFPGNIPPLVELEGKNEEDLKNVAKDLDLDWKNVCMEATRYLIENKYGIPVSKLKYFTFEKTE